MKSAMDPAPTANLAPLATAQAALFLLLLRPDLSLLLPRMTILARLTLLFTLPLLTAGLTRPSLLLLLVRQSWALQF